ncbi:MAG TPA: ATP-binding cassette domain-containing protein [Actinomycetes bacterium]|nr:ATP-binding cassette domain-containing protein [Actinomycetes bacterium]
MKVARPLTAASAVAAMVAISALLPEFQALRWTLWAIDGLLALSLTLVWGRAGIFSFGQAAFFGVGGYAYGIAAINLIDRTGETFSAVVVAVAAATLVAGLLGYFMFYGNVGDVYVAIITLATTLVLLTVMSSTAGPQYHLGRAQLGGYNGITGIPPLSYGRPGQLATPLTNHQLLALWMVVAALVASGVQVLSRRPFGRVVAAMRANEARTQLLGYDVRRVKLAVFVLGGAIAGLAGAGYAAWGLFLNPVVFGLQQAALVVIWVLVGGRASVLGAFVGAAAVQQLSASLGGGRGQATPLILGGVLIAVVLLVPSGLVPALATMTRRLLPALRRRPPPPPPAVRPAAAPPGLHGGAALRTVGVAKRFGGLAAVDGVTLHLPETGVTCLIGPNGAGKSTLFALLTGRERPSAGRILLDGADVTRRAPHQRARRGIGVKLQVPSIYPDLTTRENLWLAAYAEVGDPGLADERALELLGWLGIAARGHALAGTLSHGEQQWLEIGMALGGSPRVVLLDEPTAGMSPEETARTAKLVAELGRHASVVVVEHDMEFVRRLDAPVTMLHEGRVFVRGSLAELRADERVLDIYLGRREHAGA